MSEPRKAIRDTYDAVVDMSSSSRTGAYIYLIVKFTYKIINGSCQIDDPVPLYHDLRDETLEPRLKAGTDFWVEKEMTDFVVQGHAYAPAGIPAEKMEVAVHVGRSVKTVVVFGKRMIRWDRTGKIHITAPEPFLKLPLTYENAYGGIDWRVIPDDADTPETQFRLQTDHPGMYPRNPFGKGYLVVDGEVPDMEMPNLEDPDDLLTEDRLITGEPKLWYRQPLPWCFDWVHPYTFPRYIFFDELVDAWFPGPEDEEMPEVRRGFLPADYRSYTKDRAFSAGPHPMFYQEASYGMVFREVRPGERIVLKGMHPEKGVISFSLPERPPNLEIEIEGDSEPVYPRLLSIVCRPEEETVSMVYVGTRELPRLFIPGIHKHIPIRGYVDGDQPVEYETPPTFKDKLENAKKEHRENAKEGAGE